MTKINHDLTAFLPQEEDDFQNAEEELELDQSSELYKTIVAAIIKEEEDGDIDEEDDDLEEEDGDIDEDELEEKAPARDAGVETDSQASGRVIKRFVTKLECERNDVKDKLTRASAAGARRADDK